MAYLTAATLSHLWYYEEKYDISREAANISVLISKEIPSHPALHKVYFLLGELHNKNNEWNSAIDNYENSRKIETL